MPRLQHVSNKNISELSQHSSMTGLK